MIRCIALLTLAVSTQAIAWVAPDYERLDATQQQRDAARELAQQTQLSSLQQQLVQKRQSMRHNDTRYRELLARHDALGNLVKQRSSDLVAQRADVRDLYVTARQAAGDLANLLRESPTAPPDAQINQRLQALAANPRPLDLDALSTLWESLHEVLTQTATQSRVEVPVQVAPAQLQSLPVTRFGTVTAIARNQRVIYDHVAGVYRALPTPDDKLQRLNGALTAQTDGVVLLSFEPRHGVVRLPVTLYDTLLSSGPVGYLIVILGLAGCGLLIVRSLLIVRLRRAQRRGADYSPGSRLEAQRVLHERESNESLAGWLNACVRREVRRLFWGHAALGVIIGAAPLLGLLGTVTGMIVSFNTLRIYGSGDPQLMAGGIAQALSTTLLGLSVAIPLLLGHRWVGSLSNELVRDLDVMAVGMVAEASQDP